MVRNRQLVPTLLADAYHEAIAGCMAVAIPTDTRLACLVRLSDGFSATMPKREPRLGHGRGFSFMEPQQARITAGVPEIIHLSA